MANHRTRTGLLAGTIVVVIWLVAMSVYFWTQQSKVTAAKVRAYISSVDLAALNSAQRAAAIAELARQINALSSEERVALHMQHAWDDWFLQMTEEERAAFVEATLPNGIKQMMVSFEKMPEDTRKKTIEEAMKRLREDHKLPGSNNSSTNAEAGTNSPISLSADLERRMQTLGLTTFYKGSSAQTKAEVAPLLEEMQRLMENGAALR